MLGDTETHSDGCEKVYGVGETLKLGPSLVDEFEAGTCHKILYRARGQHFARIRMLSYPCCDVHSDAAHIVAHHLDLTRVNASPHFEIERPHRADAPLGAANSARRAVEQGQKSVARSLHFAAAMPLQEVGVLRPTVAV